MGPPSSGRVGGIVPAEALYGGDHWSVVRELATNDLFGYRDIRIWVCSAGYGLIPLGSRIHPYSGIYSKDSGLDL